MSMTNYLKLPIGDKAPEAVNAVIEIPSEGINKYEYDKQLNVFRLDRNLLFSGALSRRLRLYPLNAER